MSKISVKTTIKLELNDKKVELTYKEANGLYDQLAIIFNKTTYASPWIYHNPVNFPIITDTANSIDSPIIITNTSS